MKHWFLTIHCFLIISSHATSQQLIFKTYTAEDGLVSNPVRRIFQDSRGFIWIGTWQGLSKYDGHKFTNYTTVNGLSDNLINDMYESADGKVYVAENNGTVDILQHDAIVKKAAFRNVIINQFYITENNRVLAATDTSGLHELKNGNLVKPLQSFPHSTYNDLTDLNDSLLIGGSEGSLRIMNRQFELISEIKQSKELLIFKIYKDSKNRVWLGTNNGLKIVSIRQKYNQPLIFTILPAPFDIRLPRNHVVNDILEDLNGNLWIATTHGLIKIHPNSTWQRFSEQNGLPSANITCVYEDKEKNIWIGTWLGLSKLVAKTGIRIYKSNNGLKSNNVVSFLLSLKEDIFLIGTETGAELYNVRNNLFSSVSSEHNLHYIGFVKNSRQALFFGNNNYVGKYDSVNRFIGEYIPQAPLNNDVFCSIIDTNEIIFNGTQTGLVIGAGKIFYNENKIPYRISDLLIDEKGYLWVGTWDDGLYRVHYTNKKNNLSLTVKDFSTLLPGKNVRCLFGDSNKNIWVGTRHHGIVQLRTGNTGEYTAKQFDLHQGLMSNWIRAIGEDAKGCIWIGSDLGIDKLIPAEKSFRIFNFSRINNYFAQINAISPGSDHSLWFTSNSGLINIIDGEIENTPPPPVFITSIDLGDTSFNYNTHPAEKKVRLKYYQNQAAFEFSAPGFINEKQILYSYRLGGSTDTTWSRPANLHQVSYASLQPGQYRFEVKTKGWNEEWGVPANFNFNIRSPYWQTWWFYSLVGLLVLLLFYAFYLYRVRQLLNLEKVRNRIATDLHDDIGSTLTNINMLSEISRKNLGQPLEAEKFLHRITDEVTASGQALNDIIWSVNTLNDSMEETLSRMRRYAAELFDNSQTTCHLNLDETIEGKKLNMEQRRDVYLIYKESMNNIYKHALADNVWIDVKLRTGKLHLKIKDDGKGFDYSLVTNRNGLKNIRTRTEKWKGNVNIKTSPGNGTHIEIIIPLAG